MGNFLTYANNLRQHVPSLSPQQAEDYVNQAWRDIRDADREWSFLHTTETWLAPAIINLSGVDVTQNSDTVGLGSGANVGLLAGLNNPSLTVRQFRVGGGGPTYSIVASDVQQSTGDMLATIATLTDSSAPFVIGDVGKYVQVEGAGPSGEDLEATIAGYIDPANVTLSVAASTSGTFTYSIGSTLTLDRLYRETTVVGTDATVFRQFYQPTSSDFARLDHLLDPITGYEFAWEKGTPDEIDRVDPQRASNGNPYRIYFNHFDSTTGLPVYELWPIPAYQRAYIAHVWLRGTDFTEDTDTLPFQVPEELLLMRARLVAYEWAMVSDPDWRRRQSYANALGYVRSKYSTEGQPGRPLGLLDRALLQDRSVYRKSFIRRQRQRPMGYPIDSAFAQSHDVGWGAYPWA